MPFNLAHPVAQVWPVRCSTVSCNAQGNLCRPVQARVYSHREDWEIHPILEKKSVWTQALPWYLCWGKEAGSGLFYFSVETWPLFLVVTGQVCLIAEGTDVTPQLKYTDFCFLRSSKDERKLRQVPRWLGGQEVHLTKENQKNPACSACPLKACDQL